MRHEIGFGSGNVAPGGRVLLQVVAAIGFEHTA